MSSWVRSEQSLPRHPKTLALCRLSNLDLDVVIGRIHLLWYWALDFAFDGDLRKFDPKTIELACHLTLKQLQSAGFIDVRPYRRIHDWWDYAGNYLKLKYKNYPEKWERIEKDYQYTPNNYPKGSTKRDPKAVNGRSTRTDVPHGRPDVIESSAREAASLDASPPALKIKNYEEAKDYELCGPPLNWATDFKKQINKDPL